MNIFMRESFDYRAMGIARALGAKNWRKDVPLYDLILEQKPDVVIEVESGPKYDPAIKNQINYATAEFPDTKFVVINLMNIPYLASEELFGGGEAKEEYKADLTCFTDGIKEEHLPIINELARDFKIKIFGNTKVDSVYYMGAIRLEDYKNILASAPLHLYFNENWDKNATLNGSVGVDGINSYETLYYQVANLLDNLEEEQAKNVLVDEDTYKNYIKGII